MQQNADELLAILTNVCRAYTEYAHSLQQQLSLNLNKKDDAESQSRKRDIQNHLPQLKELINAWNQFLATQEISKNKTPTQVRDFLDKMQNDLQTLPPALKSNNPKFPFDKLLQLVNQEVDALDGKVVSAKKPDVIQEIPAARERQPSVYSAEIEALKGLHEKANLHYLKLRTEEKTSKPSQERSAKVVALLQLMNFLKDIILLLNDNYEVKWQSALRELNTHMDRLHAGHLAFNGFFSHQTKDVFTETQTLLTAYAKNQDKELNDAPKYSKK